MRRSKLRGLGYTRGEHTEITFSWDDASRTLSISSRNGAYPGMIGERLHLRRGDRRAGGALHSARRGVAAPSRRS